MRKFTASLRIGAGIVSGRGISAQQLFKIEGDKTRTATLSFTQTIEIGHSGHRQLSAIIIDIDT